MSEIAFMVITILISFFITFFLIPRYIKKAKSVGLVGKDMNKSSKPEVVEAGGVTVIMGVVFAILFYIFVKTFFLQSQEFVIETFAVLMTLLLAVFIGFIDDILGWKVGIKRSHKVLLTVPIGVPLMVVNAGESLITLPFIGLIDIGIIYPLILVPIGIIGAANGFNLLAGYNGLEAGLGVIILSVLGFVAFKGGLLHVSLFAFSAVMALLAFLIFNWFPAKVFPGDSLTYSIGALIAMVSILGNMQIIGVILFIPFILGILIFLGAKAKGMGHAEAFAKVNPNGSLSRNYKGIYHFNHLILYILSRIKKKVYEKDVTLFIYFIEIILVLIVFAFFV